tara:strand:+ start:1012 stop:1485 length:474 start_codon:yes stop_codon:yes gene_type:complete
MFKPAFDRKSIRLQDFDYSSGGLFFITICIQNHKCLLGEILNDKLDLTPLGEIVKEEWLSLACGNIILEDFVVMPNHIHGIVKLEKASLSLLIRRFKSRTTNRYIKGVKSHGWVPFNKRVWQRNYYEHIIRNDSSHQKIADYILENPINWKQDKFFQ